MAFFQREIKGALRKKKREKLNSLEGDPRGLSYAAIEMYNMYELFYLSEAEDADPFEIRVVFVKNVDGVNQLISKYGIFL